MQVCIKMASVAIGVIHYLKMVNKLFEHVIDITRSSLLYRVFQILPVTCTCIDQIHTSYNINLSCFNPFMLAAAKSSLIIEVTFHRAKHGWENI